MILTCLMEINKAFSCCTYVDLQRSVSVTHMFTFPKLETIRVSDVQSDVQIVPVDSEEAARNLL